jgi:ABC-type phosphate transport system ATPase subunit
LAQRRVSQECIYMLLGEVIEHSRTDQMLVTAARGGP